MSEDLAPLVGRLAGARVACVGDVMLDRFVYGQVERISPEAPIPVLRVERDEAMLGGAGNVVRNLVALGARVDFISVVGQDAAGTEVTALVGALEAVEPHLLAGRDRRTTIKSRFVASGQQLLRADRETIVDIDGAIADDVTRLAQAALRENAVLVLSDYAKGVLTAFVTRALIDAARKAGRMVIVDPKGRDFARYRGASLLTPNRQELAAASSMPTQNADEVEAASRAIIRECGVARVLCTRGAEGMSLIEPDRPALHLPATAREVFDVSGAGDTVIATLATAIAAGIAPALAAALANAAAGIVVAKVGTAVAYADDLAAALRQATAGEAGKIATAAQASDHVRRWRHQGLKVGFTNGCFDLLHPGHVALMSQARAACDRLVVGLNSDESVRRLKGAGRPVQNEASRASVLASLASVDLVVVFADDTPLALIEALRPDVLVKGADYSLDKVVGADLVAGWGGRVLLADLAPGHSTTATIARMSR